MDVHRSSMLAGLVALGVGGDLELDVRARRELLEVDAVQAGAVEEELLAIGDDESEPALGRQPIDNSAHLQPPETEQCFYRSTALGQAWVAGKKYRDNGA